MNIFCIRHVKFEKAGMIEKWAEEKGHKFQEINLYEKDYKFPELSEVDMLVIMGGPMSVNDEEIFEWLIEEKKFVKKCIENGKKLMGVCLGAQLIANVMGEKVYKNQLKEIGWLDINKENKSYFFDDIQNFTVFQWHGETFDIPENAVHIFSSKVCKNQAFEYENRILALQFHIEMMEENIKDIIDNCEEELLEKGEYIQSKKEIFSNNDKNIKEVNSILKKVMKKFEIIDKTKKC